MTHSFVCFRTQVRRPGALCWLSPSSQLSANHCPDHAPDGNCGGAAIALTQAASYRSPGHSATDCAQRCIRHWRRSVVGRRRYICRWWDVVDGRRSVPIANHGRNHYHCRSIRVRMARPVAVMAFVVCPSRACGDEQRSNDAGYRQSTTCIRVHGLRSFVELMPIRAAREACR